MTVQGIIILRFFWAKCYLRKLAKAKAFFEVQIDSLIKFLSTSDNIAKKSY